MNWKTTIALSGLVLAIGLSGCSSAKTTPLASTPAQPASTAAAPAAPTPAAPAQNGTPASPQTTTPAANNAAITVEEAKAIVLANTGLQETDVTFTKVHLDWDDGRQLYEVEFYSGNTEYDYDIDANTGDILSYDTQTENHAIPSGQAGPQQTAAAVDEATAKATALENVPGATEDNIRIYLDYDDGRPEYKGTIVYNDMKYDFEISAINGTVTEWEVEPVYG